MSVSTLRHLQYTKGLVSIPDLLDLYKTSQDMQNLVTPMTPVKLKPSLSHGNLEGRMKVLVFITC